jgi:NAD(P)-dependent dehydrogenase (short-subunit alcohol dehydrogenase family)
MTPIVQEDSTHCIPWKTCFRSDLFQGKVALVTGGATGIGRAIATELAMTGATVVIASRNLERCQAAADEINALEGVTGRVVAGPSTSIREEAQIQALIQHVVECYGALNMLVNNAGVYRRDRMCVSLWLDQGAYTNFQWIMARNSFINQRSCSRHPILLETLLRWTIH